MQAPGGLLGAGRLVLDAAVRHVADEEKKKAAAHYPAGDGSLRVINIAYHRSATSGLRCKRVTTGVITCYEP
jgi:hypothetical protein